MSQKPLVTIIRNGEEIPLPKEPSSYSSTTSTMIDSGTSVSGKRLGAVVRENVAQISMSWRYLTVEEWAAVNALFKTQDGDGSQFSHMVRFFDQTTGSWTGERQMSVSDRSAGLWRRDESGNVAGWIDCSLELTEV